MGIIKLDYKMSEVQGKYKHLMLSLREFQKFNANILGLGDVGKQGDNVDALAAIFDLEGFTAFCSQFDPQLVVPDYLDQLLKWLFSEISANFKKEYRPDGVVMWGRFPFFAKFLGDGILLLWETNGLGPASLGNIIINLYKVCAAYTNEFLTSIEQDFVNAPTKLRCGIARGEVIAIGGGKDFVGSCINVAARLQKVSQLSFAFPRKGLNPKECFGSVWQAEFIPKKIDIRGIGNEQLVFVCKKEFETLPPEEKKFFYDA